MNLIEKIKKILLDDKVSMLLILFYGIGLIPVDRITDSVIFIDYNISDNFQIPPENILYLFFIRVPSSIIVLLLFKRLIDFSKDRTEYVFFEVITLLYFFESVFAMFVVPITISSFSGFLSSNNSQSYQQVIELLIIFNTEVVSSILEPLLEIMRFAFIVYILIKKNLLRRSLFITISSLVITYEVICFAGAFLGIFDLLLLDIEPHLYDSYATLLIPLALFCIMILLLEKKVNYIGKTDE